MNVIKGLLIKYFESLLVVTIIFILLFIDIFVVNKITFLYFYFLPVLIAGYYIGKRGATLTATMTVLLVTFRFLISPDTFVVYAKNPLDLYFQIATWGGSLSSPVMW